MLSTSVLAVLTPAAKCYNFIVAQKNGICQGDVPKVDYPARN